MHDEKYHPGLEGVIAGETAVSTIEGGLRYRGYPVEELAASAKFPEVAYLLLYGELPGQEQLADFQSILAESSELPGALVRFLAELPFNAGAMDVLRTGISALAHFDPQADQHETGDMVDKAVRLLAQIPLLIGTRYRQSRGLDSVEPNPVLSFAANVLHQIRGDEPTPLEERAMDVSLILYAEHEFNASTFTARVVTSTQSDLYSAITAAVGALKGPLHGGANERVMEVLEEVGSPDNAEAWVRQALAEKRRIMGFGHRVYKEGDPRAVILKDYCRELAEAAGRTDLEETAEVIERIVREEKGLPPNLDWPSARLYHYLGLEVELYTPLFVASRVAGWAAHVIEQAENNRLIRPRSRYVGEEKRRFVPLEQRG
ncbi:MAG: citrate/2-methylcitrate synthase [Planctomycetales bacterium]